MKFNKIRWLLIICNLLFVLLGAGIFYVIGPSLQETAERIIINDTKATLLINTNYIREAIANESFKHNFGLTTYLIPKDRNGRLMTHMYSFYILNENGIPLYATDKKYLGIRYFRDFGYINESYGLRDNSGQTEGVLGNRIQYIISRTVVNEKNHLMVYEVDMKEVEKGVLAFQFFFYTGFFVSVIIILILSLYIDKQYNKILEHQQDTIEAYKLLDNTGSSTEAYLSRIKKVLHAFSFTTSILFAINDQRVVIFKNNATIDAERRVLGKEGDIFNTPETSNWNNYRLSLVEHIEELLTTDKTYTQWTNKTYDVDGNVFYSNNRIKKIVVDGDVVLVCEVQDITTLTLANEAIKNYSKYLETIFNTVPNSIVVIDLLGNIKDVNDAFTLLFGYTLDDVRHKNIEKIVRSDCSFADQTAILCNCITKSGDVLKCEIYQNYLVLPYDDKMQVLVIQDVTEREMLRKQIFSSIAVSTETIKTMAGNI